MMIKEDLTGQVFDDLTVIKFAYKNTFNYWECLCTCGNTKIISVSKLHKGIGTKCRHYSKSQIDLTNQQFGELTAIKPIRINNIPHWECKCSCGNIKNINTYYLQQGVIKHCGDYKKHPKINLIGQKFNKLTVLSVDEDGKDFRWICKCDCGKITFATTYQLMSGIKMSCGCGYKESSKNTVKPKTYHSTNKYDLSGKYGIGWTSNKNTEFYFDLEDYDKIKDYLWRENHRGYIETSKYDKETHKTKSILMHRMIMNEDNPLIVIDHIHHNKTDNRKSELRATTQDKNVLNHPIQKNNRTGVTGVHYLPNKNKYFASIRFNKQNINLGYFDNFDDAVKIRKEAEQKYFGEYAYDKS